MYNVNLEFTIWYYVNMIFGDKTRLEEYIIELLDEGSLDGPNLLTSLENMYNKKTTKLMCTPKSRLLNKKHVYFLFTPTYIINTCHIVSFQKNNKQNSQRT